MEVYNNNDLVILIWMFEWRKFDEDIIKSIQFFLLNQTPFRYECDWLYIYNSDVKIKPLRNTLFRNLKK